VLFDTNSTRNCTTTLASLLPNLLCSPLQLVKFVNDERSSGKVYPPPKDVFSWTLACAIKDVSIRYLQPHNTVKRCV
jgi:hypothetical protein